MFQEAQDGGSDGEQDAVEDDSPQLDVSRPQALGVALFSHAITQMENSTFKSTKSAIHCRLS